MKKRFSKYHKGQKWFTKSQRHRMLVRREKKSKQSNVSMIGRQLRTEVVQSRRASGIWKRAIQARKIRRAEMQLRRSLGWQRYDEYLNARKDPRKTAFMASEPVIA